MNQQPQIPQHLQLLANFQAHIAIAAAASADYLLTWNCRHLANAQIMKRLEAEAKRQGWKLPKVCTPVELMGESPYEG